MTGPLALACLVLFFYGSSAAGSGAVGKVYPGESRDVPNPTYGVRITQWTSTGSNHHLYFNVESFLDPDRCIIISDRSGGQELFMLSLTDGSMTQMTADGRIDGVWHTPALGTLWYKTGRTIKVLDTKTYASRTVCTFDTLQPESFTVTPDGRMVVFAANKRPGWSANHSTGPYALYRLDLQSMDLSQISPDLGFKIGHVQANPVDPGIVSYCWQHAYREDAPGIVGNTPVRIWWNRVDGTGGGPLGIQEFGLHRTHEFWFPDGRAMGYSARYHFGPNKGKQYIGMVTADGQENVLMEANVGAAHSQVSPDGKHWVADLFDGPYLVLFAIDGRAINRTRVLFRHDSSWGSQATHPHPHFSPDGRCILFSTDRTGRPQVYTADVDIGTP